jgi:hypothetical protein
VAAHELRERLERVPRDGLAFVDREVTERLDEMALAGAAGAANAKRLCPLDPFQRLQRLLGLFGDR